MKHRYFKMLLFILLMTSGFLVNLQAQDSPDWSTVQAKDLLRVETHSGSTYIGHVTSMETDVIKLETIDGVEIEIKKSSVKKVKELNEAQIKQGTYYFENPMPNRNFLTETAYGLEKGTGFYQNVMIFINSFGYGVSDHFSITAGFESVSLFAGGDFPVFFVQPKYTFTERDAKTQFAVGANLIAIPDGSSRDIVGTLYGATTFGSVDNNFTIGAAFPYGAGDVSGEPLIQIGGQVRLSKSIGLVTDNIIVTNGNSSGALITALMRVMKESWSFDIGLATASEAGGAIPVLGLNLKFGG